MKKLLFVLIVITSFNLNAQYITNHANNVEQNLVDGVFYNLPRNVIKLDFTVEKSQYHKGKYSDYAKEMLDTEDYIEEDNTKFSIKEIHLSLLTEPDPDMTFFVSTDDKSKEPINLCMELTPNGIISSFGYQDALNTVYEDVDNEYVAYDANESTDYYYIPLHDDDEDDEETDDDTMEHKTKLSEKDIALSIIKEIKNLRIAYFDLITGYQEVNYGNTITYMVDQVKALETEYLSMFLGSTETTSFTKTFYIIPEEGTNSIVISKFSENEGFNSKSGNVIKINFSDISVSSVNKMSKDAIEKMTYENKLFYRIPANVNIKITSSDNVIYEDRTIINQLGSIALIPINKAKLVFDINTGQIISYIK